MTEDELNRIWDALSRGDAIEGWISWPHQDREMLRHRDTSSFETWRREAHPRTAWGKVARAVA